ncbi:methyl-accepting chemotaxis protein [Halalkalibacter nanhaiisediminis]|uniref:Methyl-accepting chemotaxis protein (MCP) signaling protein n=1 Tax=Halalkalibacter nanhaiisediminis TaxID=688079 RepID=A0A562QHE6_9BACI|nr:methyl-accepting chemotaxis protein [Halalkalibacter nanhaiisediminis]TWI56164.1 methyl-accepting chemotaxis protein (MCP) signaling protein [Halalkalibacter nanhaiisediminis]
MNILDALVISAPVIQQLLKGEATLGVINKKEFLCYLPSEKIDFGIKTGDPVSPKDENLQNALNGKIAQIMIPTEVYGFPVNATSLPIKDENGKVIGALAYAVPFERQQKLDNYMEQIYTIVDDLQEKVQVLSAHSQELAASGEDVKEQSASALRDSKKSHEVVNFIKQVSRQTNLLGINASIEASRAGSAGAGFKIVATEVRKLSTETSDASEKINHSLNEITSSIHLLLENVEQITDSSNNQAVLVTDFSEIIERLSTISDELKAFTNDLLV